MCSTAAPSPALQLVPAAKRDRGPLLQFIAQLYDHETIPFDGDRVGDSLDHLLQSPHWGSVFLLQRPADNPADPPITVGYSIVAYLYSLEFGGRVALIDELWIDPNWRGQGLGRQALERIEQDCRDRAIVALRLEVGRTNQTARALYQRMGFQDLDRDFWTKPLSPAAIGDPTPSH
ncbi:MAG: GNAT family N-acetyltransferase [Cyanobacteria bacterium]|nr:GNAT family N-acetyltransferase [Cyanobacteriota bacterium]